jgi:hypothetical protein
MVAGGSQKVIIWWEPSPDGGGRIYCKVVIIRWDNLSGLWREDLL